MATISLAMIVKNEAKTIERVLNAAKPFCDELIVVDTGSTDDTVTLARQAGAQVFYFDWIYDFSAARNTAFGHCTCDWILWLDADDVILENHRQQLLSLKSQLHNDIDAVFMTYAYAPGFCFPRERLIRRESGLSWEYAIHECIAVPSDKRLDRLGIVIHHQPLPENAQGKANRNIDILERQIKQGNQQPRIIFYYANELYDHKRYAEAIPRYQERIAMGGWNQELFYSYYRIGLCHVALTHEPALITEAFLKAYETTPNRAEPLYELAKYHRLQEQYAMGYLYAKVAAAMPLPTHDALFVHSTIYQYQALDELSICAYWIGCYQESDDLCQRLLSQPDLPEADITRIRDNMDWARKQLADSDSP